jgi:hypothetical protein
VPVRDHGPFPVGTKGQRGRGLAQRLLRRFGARLPARQAGAAARPSPREHNTPRLTSRISSGVVRDVRRVPGSRLAGSPLPRLSLCLRERQRTSRPRGLPVWTIGGGLGVRDVETLARVRERHSRRRRSGRPVDGRCLGTSAASPTPSSLPLRTSTRCSGPASPSRLLRQAEAGVSTRSVRALGGCPTQQRGPRAGRRS